MDSLVELSTKLYERAANRIDPRVADYMFVSPDPRPVFGIIGFYILFIILGKRYMSTRPAFNVPIWVLFLYNFSLVVLSIHIVKEIVIGVYQAKYNLLCQPLSTSTDTAEMRVVNALWWYYISKAMELFDTVWMVLRKKNVQISFLHVFHHASMLLIEWIVFASVPAGQTWFGAGLNSFVHIIMYFYYALSIIPSLKDSLWWKKYLTYFQLAQFILTFSHTVQGICFGCDFPIWGQYLQSSYCVLMFILFSNFFRQEYIKKQNYKKRLAAEKNVDINNNPVETKKAK